MGSKMAVAIVDYDIGNLFSVQNALKLAGLDSVITSDRKTISEAPAVILPGVGAFGDAMLNLARLDLICPIRDYIDSGRPFMGICLGLQLLFSESEEFGQHRGMDIIPGTVKKIPAEINGRKVKVPQIAWNQIFEERCSWNGTMLEGIKNGEYMYFVHSYYVVPENPDDVLTKTEYEGMFYCSSVRRKNLFASQFHPEKSGAEGIRIYENFKRNIATQGDNHVCK